MMNFYDILRKDLEEREKNVKAAKNATILNDLANEDYDIKNHTSEEIMEALKDDQAFMIFVMRAGLDM